MVCAPLDGGLETPDQADPLGVGAHRVPVDVPDVVLLQVQCNKESQGMMIGEDFSCPFDYYGIL